MSAAISARIGEQAERGVLAVLAGLVLELGHAVHPADARDAVEDPGELGVLRHAALVEDDVLLRVDAGGDEAAVIERVCSCRSSWTSCAVIECRSTTQ
jgi:hypothetical protein